MPTAAFTEIAVDVNPPLAAITPARRTYIALPASTLALRIS